MHSHLKIHSRNLGKPIRKLGILWQRMTGNIFYWGNKERQVIKELLKGFISNVLIKIFPVLRSGFWLISWTYSYMEIRQILQVSQHKYLMTSDFYYEINPYLMLKATYKHIKQERKCFQPSPLYPVSTCSPKFSPSTLTQIHTLTPIPPEQTTVTYTACKNSNCSICTKHSNVNTNIYIYIYN